MLKDKEKIKELQKICKIAPDNISVDFIYWRFLQDNYRGLHLLQHNRWSFEKFKSIMFAIFYSQDEYGYIKIPKGDEGKSFFIGEYEQYNNLVKLFNKKYKEITGKDEGTPNTIKKNLFPDLARMGLIDRYCYCKKNGLKLLDPNKKGQVDLIKLKSYVSIEEKIKDNNFLKTLYNNISKNFYKELPFLIFELLNDEEMNGKIEDYEFLFFITWYNKEIPDDIPNEMKLFAYDCIKTLRGKKINFNKVKKLILEWRKLNLSAKKQIIEIVKKWADRKKFKKVSKNQKRDFANLKNQTQEIMQHIKDSELFALNEDATRFEIVFKEGKKNKRYRNNSSKIEYLKNHKVKKEKGFEFDHIVPFSWSLTSDEALKICSWKNLIYIDGKSHAIKTQSSNIYVYLSKRDEISYLYLESHDSEDFLSLKLNINVLFNISLFDDIKNYNLELNNLLSKK